MRRGSPIFCAPVSGGLEWWWPSLWGQVLLLAITCGALYPACQWAACQGQMARKGVSCIVSSSSTPGQGRLCRRGTDESISSLDHGLLAPTDGCLSGSLHGVRSAGGGRGSVIVCSSKAGSRLSCGCYGGVDQIWPSEIPARFEQATPRWASHSRLGKGGFRFV